MSSRENGKNKIYHTGLVENYVAYMYIYPSRDKAGVSDLTGELKEKLKELLNEKTADIIYRFLEMIEEHDDEFKIIIEKDGEKLSLTDISEKMGSVIADVE